MSDISSEPFITTYTLAEKLAERVFLESWDSSPAITFANQRNSTQLRNDQHYPCIVFTTPEQLRTSLKFIQANGKPSYLIIGRSDTEITLGIADLILSCNLIIGFAAQNTRIKNNSKIINIPLGLENRTWGMAENNNLPVLGNEPIYYERYLSRRYEISSQIPSDALISFSIGTNESMRKPFLKQALLNPYSKILMFPSRYLDNNNFKQKKYFDATLECSFIVCPEGNGIDTHRFWECLYLGLVPVILEESLLPCYERLIDFGFNICVLPNVESISSHDFAVQSKQIRLNNWQNNYFNPLHIQFWVKQIKSHVNSLLGFN